MKKFLVVVVVAAVIAAVYLLLSDTEVLPEGQVMRTGTLEISNKTSYKHDVSFPETFSELPEVEIRLVKGSGYLEILETRLDGFSFKTSNLGYSEAEGAHVEWKATGLVNKQQKMTAKE
jgi:hypothetical protein